ncbi:MAG: NAD(P)H-binding protein [Bacteroidota bacterium]
MKKAILFGATGFVGSNLLDELLNHADYGEVIVVVRKNLKTTHPKLEILIGDFQSLPQLKEKIVADEIFIALGTTKKNTPDVKEYYQVDHDYPVLAARIAKGNGATSVFVVTAVGANTDSGVAYIKTKGEVERDIIALGFQHTHIFRPSMIMGTREEKRLLEKALITIWSIVNVLLVGKLLNKYKGIAGKNIARAMINSASNQTKKIKIYEWKEMNDLLQTRSI